MNYEETLEYIHSTSSVFCKPGLDRINALLDALGHPERDMKYIHVAGTNGKGSSCSMLAEILSAEGYRVGLYTSPYVRRFNERMRISGVEISDEELIEITELVRPIAEKMSDRPTEFELITAIAFEYFRRGNCEVVVLEVGMGGRLDSTNVIDAPLLSIITGISLDHVAFLGDTVEKIAFEKAGIIKESSPVLFGGEDSSALSVIKEVAEERKSPLYTVDYSALSVRKRDLSGTEFSYRDWKNMKISLLGSYQPRNAAIVLTAVDILRKRGLSISERAVRDGLLCARWPARFEIIAHSPTVIFDGAHNAEGIAAAVDSIKEYFGDKRVIVFTGVLSDKDYEAIAKSISEVASHAFTITPQNPRALSADKYSNILVKYGVNAIPCKNIAEAIEEGVLAASERNTALCCLGSLYTYSGVVDALKIFLQKR